jgi:hypothetical protein
MQHQKLPLSRRAVLKWAAALWGAQVASLSAQDGSDAAPAPAHTQSPVDPTAPRAVLLGFVTDHQLADSARWQKKREDVDGQQQCRHCALFQGTDNTTGSCALFHDQQVPAAGWCNAWTAR